MPTDDTGPTDRKDTIEPVTARQDTDGRRRVRFDWHDPATARYGSLLVILILSFIFSGFDAEFADVAVWALNILVVLSAFKLTRLTSTRASVLILAALATVALAIGVTTEVSDGGRGAAYLLQFTLMGYITIALLRSILRRDRVDGQTLLGTFAAYFMIGLTFAWLYLAIDVWDNDQFNLDPSNTAEYPEFSFITMTTVGFGNQIPTANLAARIVVLQVLIAQFFLATFVARMVSLYRRPGD